MPGLPGNAMSFYIVPLDPAHPAKAGRDTFRSIEGIVEERLAPPGYIRVHGELWQAEVVRADVSIERGEPVRIRGIKGLRLQVERKH
jgi:membrane-bound ClpP family serine protease